MANRNSLRLVVGVVAFLLVGCVSTYKMPGLPGGGLSEIAVLEHQDKSLNSKFFIIKIDGRVRGIGWVDRFELIPGRRAVTGEINRAYFRGNNIVRYFTAEAGKSYLFVARGDLKAKRWDFAIIDKVTGERVDSAAP